jgi:hypothetical protein
MCQEMKAKLASVWQEESCLPRRFVSCAGLLATPLSGEPAIPAFSDGRLDIWKRPPANDTKSKSTRM